MVAMLSWVHLDGWIPRSRAAFSARQAKGVPAPSGA